MGKCTAANMGKMRFGICAGEGSLPSLGTPSLIKLFIIYYSLTLNRKYRVWSKVLNVGNFENMLDYILKICS